MDLKGNIPVRTKYCLQATRPSIIESKTLKKKSAVNHSHANKTHSAQNVSAAFYS